MKRKQLRFIGHCLAVGLISALIMGTLSCSSKSTTATPNRVLKKSLQVADLACRLW